jgi:xylulose-5-phosphate/fructose-6-phosphate phosphoketolase
VVRVWLPPDANTTLSMMDHCLRSTDHVNLIVVDKQKHLQYLTLEQANAHCADGAGVWEWASTCAAGETPDIVLACAGDVPTQEALAAVELLHEHVPDLKVRFVNVVDLMALLPENDHPHGFTDSRFDDLFTADRHVVFAFHGYPRAVHQLIHGRSDPGRFHVRGFSEQGTTTTPFDMVVLNRMSRFHLAREVLRRANRRTAGWDRLVRLCDERLAEHDGYIREHLADLPDIAEWTWRGLDR